MSRKPARKPAAAAPGRTMGTCDQNAQAHPGLVDITLSSPTQPAPKKRKRAPPLSKEEKQAKKDKTVAAVKAMSALEVRMASQAKQDLQTPQTSSHHAPPQRTGSYIAPDPDPHPMSDLTELDPSDNEAGTPTNNEAETVTEHDPSSSEQESRPKAKKKNTKRSPKKKVGGLRSAIATYSSLPSRMSDSDTVSTI